MEIYWKIDTVFTQLFSKAISFENRLVLCREHIVTQN